ncbi:MAG: serine protease [Gammaproteobacteria bacterium]
MFADAYRIASCFTLPVVISSRSHDGACKSAIGACVVVNRDGWILTTAHLIHEIHRQQQSAAKYAGAGKGKGKAHAVLRPSAGAVKNHSVWWGRDGAQLHQASVMPAADLALGRLQPFDAGSVAHYPAFKKPGADYRPGRSLCKLGFPFHAITPAFDEKKNAFVLPPGAVPLPLFPLEGIFTRVVVEQMSPERMSPEHGGEAGKFIETSSPGLVGQSGGPVVDAHGAVWAVQSHTQHHSLGFSPPVPGQNGATQKEHQFLNAGLGVHAEVILSFLQGAGVAHQTAE